METKKRNMTKVYSARTNTLYRWFPRGVSSIPTDLLLISTGNNRSIYSIIQIKKPSSSTGVATESNSLPSSQEHLGL